MRTPLKKIIIFGSIPPPLTGAAISNQYVYDILKEYYSIYILNTSVGYNKPKSNILKSLKYNYLTIIIYLKCIYHLSLILRKHRIYAFYFLPSCNLLGHLKDSILLLLFGKRIGKIIGQLHNSNFKVLFNTNIYKYLTYKLYNDISIFIFSSKILSDECDKYLSNGRRTYFYNTINPAVLCTNSEISLKLHTKFTSNYFNILFVGHMLFSKGCFDLLKACELLRSSGKSNFKVTFIGGWIDNFEETEFNNFIINKKMENYIDFLGIIRDPALLKCKYLESDIFALPTYYPYESQPLAIIDAMNAGNPIISTNQGTISEFIIPGKNGYIINKHHPQQICDTIEAIMDRNLWLKLAKQARIDFENKFSLDIYSKNLLNVLE